MNEQNKAKTAVVSRSNNWSSARTKKMVYTAMLAAVAGVLMTLEFNIPMMPPFYKIDFSDVPTMIAVFLMGPVSGCAVEVLKLVVKLVTVGTTTAYIGEIANLIGILIFVIPLHLIYKSGKKTFKAAVIAMIAIVPLRTALACGINAFITLPMFAAANGMPLESVIAFVGSVNPAIKSLGTFIIFATIPFNILKISLNCIVGYFLYSRLRKFDAVTRDLD